MLRKLRVEYPGAKYRAMTLLSLAAAAAWLSTANSMKAADTPNSSTVQTPKQFKFQKTIQADVDYLLFLPKGCEPTSEKRWPLILFLHGAGERGANVWKVATHGPPKLVAQRPDFPFIVVSPQCPEGRVWSNDVLLGLLDEVRRAYPVDASRVYLTGLSMGGYGTWSLGLSYPEKFAGIVPICGGGELLTVLLARGEPTKGAALRSLGVWAFHGAKDPIVPLAESERMVELLKKSGVADVKLTVYPDAQHDSWTEAYRNPELYDWLLQHKR